MSTLFVTGGTGFIGAALVRRAALAGKRVQVLTRSDASAQTLRRAGVEAVTGDLLIPGRWQEAAADAAEVIHLAQPDAFGGRVTRSRAEAYRARRLKMDAVLFDALGREGSRRVVYVAGTSYYGDQGGELRDEDAAPNPSGWGPWIAPAMDQLARRIQAGAPTVVVFPGWVYGPGSWFAEYFLRPLYKGQRLTGLRGDSPWVSPIQDEDCARAILFLLERGALGRRYFAVDDQPVRASALAHGAARALEVSCRTRTVPRWFCRLLIGPVVTQSLTSSARLSNGRLRQLGFELEYPTLERGIPAVIQRWKPAYLAAHRSDAAARRSQR